MITIRNFVEAHQLYREGKLPLRLLQEQTIVLFGYLDAFLSSTTSPAGIDDYLCGPAYGIPTEVITWLATHEIATEDFAGILGGDVYVCETEEDLRQIQGMDMQWAESHGNTWPSVVDLPMSWDQCSYIEEQEGDPQFVVFLMCWNDAGGSVFYVPKHLWQTARVEEHMALTSRFPCWEGLGLTPANFGGGGLGEAASRWSRTYPRCSRRGWPMGSVMAASPRLPRCQSSEGTRNTAFSTFTALWLPSCEKCQQRSAGGGGRVTLRYFAGGRSEAGNGGKGGARKLRSGVVCENTTFIAFTTLGKVGAKKTVTAADPLRSIQKEKGMPCRHALVIDA